MLGLHYVPGGHVCPKRSAPWDFGPFSNFIRSCYVFLRSLTASHGMRDGPWRVAGGLLQDAQRRGTARPVRLPIYYECQHVASRAVTVWWGFSPFSRSNQGLTRLSRSLKTLCGWSVDTGQLWSAFEHILPLNQFERRFWWLILHLIGQGVC